MKRLPAHLLACLMFGWGASCFAVSTDETPATPAAASGTDQGGAALKAR